MPTMKQTAPGNVAFDLIYKEPIIDNPPRPLTPPKGERTPTRESLEQKLQQAAERRAVRFFNFFVINLQIVSTFVDKPVVLHLYQKASPTGRKPHSLQFTEATFHNLSTLYLNVLFTGSSIIISIYFDPTNVS